MEEIKRAFSLLNDLNKLRPLEQSLENKIMQKFRLDWNYHSNHLEGNSLTYGETKALLLFGITAQGKPLKDAFEITGHNEAIDWVIEMVNGERPLTENFIRELHSLLLKDTYKESKSKEGLVVPRKISAGKYKTTPNHVQTITGEIFYFATPEETPAKMFDLINWYEKEVLNKDVNPILLAAEFHYKFIRIHPFDDGNGRTARILMNFILMKFGFPPVIIKTEDKSNYFAALQMADAGNIEHFIIYIAKNLNYSLSLMISGANGYSIEDEDDIDKEIALLEQKLVTFGEKIDKVKNEEVIYNIYKNTIHILANEIKQKLKNFEKYFVNANYYLKVQDKSSVKISKEMLDISEIGLTNEIKIYIDFRTIKIKNLENYSFSHSIEFNFKELSFFVTEDNHKNNKLFEKHYQNLTNKERKELIKYVIVHFNSLLNEAIK